MDTTMTNPSIQFTHPDGPVGRGVLVGDGHHYPLFVGCHTELGAGAILKGTFLIIIKEE